MAQHIVIVGGGAAGTLTALQLARHARSETKVTVIEPRRLLGTGVAYGTVDTAHLLNVPAIGMSAYDDDPTSFVRWARCSAGDFIARNRYADYLRSELSGRVAENSCITFRHVRATVERIEVGADRVATEHRVATAHTVTTSDGQNFEADAIVLALGNAAPTVPDWVHTFAAAPVVTDPWAAGALDHLDKGAKVLCVGTGLTFVDIALSLARRGVRVTGVSRHGLLPEVHAPTGEVPHLPAHFRSPGDVLRWIRTHDDWRAAFTALRPATQQIWRAFSVAQQSQFLRHARRYWDVHRHRMSAAIADELQQLCNSGAVGVQRGDARLAALSGRYDAVVLCTGPDDAALRSAPPLARLISDGIACAGPHDMGIATDADTGQLLSADGRLVNGVFAIGTLRRGTLWESTAIPEIRTEAGRLAALVLR